MFGYVFFDLDGTLLNTLDDLAAAGNYALGRLGLPAYDTDRYRYFVGNGIPKLIERILPENANEQLKVKCHAYFSEYYAAHSEDKTKPYAGIPELLDKLYSLGVKTVVITNKDHVYAVELMRKYFGDRITAVYGSRPGTPNKPDPYWVNKAVSELGAVKSEILYVGDSGVDMQTASNAGLESAGVLWGFRDEKELLDNGAHKICKEPFDILTIVKG